MDIPFQIKHLATEKLISAKESENINCHKATLYLCGLITYEELIFDPRKQQDIDFTFREKALKISSKPFTTISSSSELQNLAEKECNVGIVYIVQILDTETNELAHSGIAFKTAKVEVITLDKAGFKGEFSICEISELLTLKNYQNQDWRFVALNELR